MHSSEADEVDVLPFFFFLALPQMKIKNYLIFSL